MIDFTKQLPTPQSDLRTKQYFLIFSIITAGKKASNSTKKTWEFLQWAWGQTPFEYIESLIQQGKLEARLKACKIGMYSKLKNAFRDAITLDVETCTLEDLLECHGIGHKTARFFLLNTRKDAEYAALDTHILKWVDSHLGLFMDIPKSTPTNNRLYQKIEYNAIKLMRKHFPDLTLAQADFEIWKQYAKP